MGRSRGGLTTKIHAVVDATGKPVYLKLTPGQAHDGRSAHDKGTVLLAESAYDSDYLRAQLREKGAVANIKPMPNRKEKPAFDKLLYRLRNKIERFFNKIKRARAIATRYDRRDDNFLASIQIALIRIILKNNESAPQMYSTAYFWYDIIIRDEGGIMGQVLTRQRHHDGGETPEQYRTVKRAWIDVIEAIWYQSKNGRQVAQEDNS